MLFSLFFFNLFIFFIKGGHLFTFLLIFPPFHSPYSSVLSNLWKSLNLCLKLYLICSSSTASLCKFIQMDKEEDAFDISAVPGGCGRSLANSYKREVILGTVWICMYRFGLVYSRSVFETCLNICYWCMNNTAIYNLFSGKETGHCHQERQPACLRGSCLCFGSLQGQNKSKKSPSSTTFSRWRDVFELLLGQAEPSPEELVPNPTPGSWGSSRLSLRALKQSPVMNVQLCYVVKRCQPTTWYPYFSNLLENWSSSPWSTNFWSSQGRQVAGALEQVHLCLDCRFSFCS